MPDLTAERERVANDTLVRAAELHAKGDYAAAAALYAAALSIAPEHPDILQLYGVLCAQVGDPSHAALLMRRSLEIKPDQPVVLANLGALLRTTGQPGEAIVCLQRAVELTPPSAQPALLLECSRALADLRRLSEALASADAALALAPGDAAALRQRGAVLLLMHRFEEAHATFSAVTELEPGNVHAWLDRAVSAHEIGENALAQSHCERALAIAPDLLRARMTALLCELPAVAATIRESADSRAAYTRAMASFARWVAGHPSVDAEAPIGGVATFYLGYRATDNRADLATFGAAWTSCLADWTTAAGIPGPAPRAPGQRRRRVGIVTAYVREHSVYDVITRTFIAACEKAGLEVALFVPSVDFDEETQYVAARVHRFEQGQRSVGSWARLIAQAECDVLVYPEVGMDETVLKLAGMRLAAWQIASWGHPQTTGLPTIDAYVSAAALEPPDAQADYTESLILLPGLGCHLSPGTLLPVGAQASNLHLPSLGLDPGQPVYVCPGTPFKYAPEHDDLLADIAVRVGPCQFAFFEFEQRAELSQRLLERLGRAFTSRGLDWTEYLRLVPHLPKATFRDLCSRATAMLDTIGFSGFNTAVHALEAGALVVASEGRYMRGRLASGTMRYLHLDDLVATDDAAYVNMAVRLALDPAHAMSARQRSAAARSALYRSDDAIAELARWLEGATAAPSGGVA